MYVYSVSTFFLDVHERRWRDSCTHVRRRSQNAERRTALVLVSPLLRNPQSQCYDNLLQYLPLTPPQKNVPRAESTAQSETTTRTQLHHQNSVAPRHIRHFETNISERSACTTSTEVPVCLHSLQPRPSSKGSIDKFGVPDMNAEELRKRNLFFLGFYITLPHSLSSSF